MIERLGRRLRVVPGRLTAFPERVEESPGDVEAAAQQIEFVAYAEDCILSGIVQMAADRLTDMLNDHDEYQLADVVVESLADGRAVRVNEVLVRREELLLVHVAGPRGDQDRRRRTRSHPVAIQMGPYHVRGYLHGLPGTDPVQTFGRREPMVPLTDAWIDFPLGLDRERRRVGTVVVNRDQIDWIAPAVVDEVEMPDLPLSAEQGKLLKDFTGVLFEHS